jgi:hypothetical protein
MTLEDKIRYAIAKIRNVIYYRIQIDENMREERFRGQYMHVLRQYRKDLLVLVEEIPEGDSRRTFFEEMIQIINPKVKTNECLDTIERLEWYLGKNGIKIE